MGILLSAVLFAAMSVLLLLPSAAVLADEGSCVSDPTSVSGDPMLGPSAYNVGPTTTQALLAGTIAMDAGDCAGATVTEEEGGVVGERGSVCGPELCTDGSIPLIDPDGDFSGWCMSLGHADWFDIFVHDVNLGAGYALVELNWDYYQLIATWIDFFQVCPDADTVDRIYILDESLGNASGVDWTRFDWIIAAVEQAWFDVAASALYKTAPFATSQFDDFIAPNRAKTLAATDGTVPAGTSFFAGSGTGELVIGVDLSSDLPVVFSFVEHPLNLAIVGLTVESNAAGVPVEVSPADLSGEADGQTSFIRRYMRDTQVTLTAPARFAGRSFVGWKLDGVMQAPGVRTVGVTVADAAQAEAVYRAAAFGDQRPVRPRR
jgi:hypothetical protein